MDEKRIEKNVVGTSFEELDQRDMERFQGQGDDVNIETNIVSTSMIMPTASLMLSIITRLYNFKNDILVAEPAASRS